MQSLDSDRFLQGRTALVTGAGRGIGKAIAIELASLGAKTILVGRDAIRLQHVAQEITDLGGKAISMPTDVRDNAWMQSLRSEAYAVDIAVHGATAFAAYGPLEQRSDEEMLAVVDTSLIVALRIAAALLPGMKNRNYGKFFFLGSAVAMLGAANQTIYATAKAGLQGLVRSLVVENAHTGINAHLLELGLIDTERTRENVTDSVRTRLIAHTPAGRIGSTRDVAKAIRFLLSADADFIRGITLPITGGFGLGILPMKAPS
jgi:3-oxoacyl-[acyl-carrier protein] reductase